MADPHLWLIFMLILAVFFWLCAIALRRLICKENKDAAKQISDQDKMLKRLKGGGKGRGQAYFAIDCQNANSNLNFNKTTQWTVTYYYAVLLFGALDTIYLQLAKALWIQSVLILLAHAVFLASLHIAVSNQFQIRRERLSLLGLRLEMAKSDEERGGILCERNKGKRFFSHPWINITVIATIVVSYLSFIYVVSL